MNGLPIPSSRDRRQAVAAATMWGLLFAVEVLALSVLAVVLLPAGWMKAAAVLALVAGSGFVLARIVLAPLWTHHLLTPDALIVRYGRDRLVIPHSRIVSVEPAHERLPGGYQPGFSADARRSRIVAALAPSGQVLIELDPPLEPIGARVPFPVREILINADDPAPLLALAPGPEGAAPDEPDPLGNASFPPPGLRAASGEADEGIACLGVSKRYGDRLAINALTLHVAPGEIYGLLGPNGAGKSTTIAMLTGIMRPDAGVIRLAGHDLHRSGLEARRRLGHVPDRPILYETLTGREFLTYIAHLRAIPHETAAAAIDGLIAALGIGAYADALCRTFSFGTRSKVALAAALLHDPRILVLDEPFNGLDPQSCHDVRRMLIDRANAGVAILLSTHDLAIAEALCDRIGILANGTLVAEGDLDALTDGGTVSLDDRFRTLTRSASARVPAGAR